MNGGLSQYARVLAHCNDNRRPTMAGALTDIGRTPSQDWLLDIDFVALKAKWAAEDDVFTDDYGRSL